MFGGAGESLVRNHNKNNDIAAAIPKPFLLPVLCVLCLLLVKRYEKEEERENQAFSSHVFFFSSRVLALTNACMHSLYRFAPPPRFASMVAVSLVPLSRPLSCSFVFVTTGGCGPRVRQELRRGQESRQGRRQRQAKEDRLLASRQQGSNVKP